MFLKIGTTWFNLNCITRVDEVKSRTEPSRLNVYLTDKATPLTVVEQIDVQAVLAYLESKATTGPLLADKLSRESRENPKKAA